MAASGHGRRQERRHTAHLPIGATTSPIRSRAGDWIQLDRANTARVAAGAVPVPGCVIDTQNVYTMPANVKPENAVSGYKYTAHSPTDCRWN